MPPVLTSAPLVGAERSDELFEDAYLDVRPPRPRAACAPRTEHDEARARRRRPGRHRRRVRQCRAGRRRPGRPRRRPRHRRHHRAARRRRGRGASGRGASAGSTASCTRSGMSGRRLGDGPVGRVHRRGLARGAPGQSRLGVLPAARRPVARWPARAARSSSSARRWRRTLDDDFLTAAYASAKGALVPLVRSAAFAARPTGVRVNIVAAGLVDTPMAARAMADPGDPGPDAAVDAARCAGLQPRRDRRHRRLAAVGRRLTHDRRGRARRRRLAPAMNGTRIDPADGRAVIRCCGTATSWSSAADRRGRAAAVAAARQGASTLLVESAAHLGGTGASVLDTFYGFYAPGTGRARRRRHRLGGVRGAHRPQAAFERPNTYGAGTGVTYDPETLKLVWDELTGRRRGAGPVPRPCLTGGDGGPERCRGGRRDGRRSRVRTRQGRRRRQR